MSSAAEHNDIEAVALEYFGLRAEARGELACGHLADYHEIVSRVEFSPMPTDSEIETKEVSLVRERGAWAVLFVRAGMRYVGYTKKWSLGRPVPTPISRDLTGPAIARHTPAGWRMIAYTIEGRLSCDRLFVRPLGRAHGEGVSLQLLMVRMLEAAFVADFLVSNEATWRRWLGAADFVGSQSKIKAAFGFRKQWIETGSSRVLMAVSTKPVEAAEEELGFKIFVSGPRSRGSHIRGKMELGPSGREVDAIPVDELLGPLAGRETR